MLDIVKHRSSNNIFGQDLWGLSTSNQGLYGSVLNMDAVYTTGQRTLIKNLSDRYKVAPEQMKSAVEIYKKNNPYLHREDDVFTNFFHANDWRMARKLPLTGYPLTREEYTGYDFQMPHRSNIKQSIFGTRDFTNHFWGGARRGGGSGAGGPGGGGSGGGGHGGVAPGGGGLGPGGGGLGNVTKGGPGSNTLGLPAGFTISALPNNTQGGPGQTTTPGQTIIPNGGQPGGGGPTRKNPIIPNGGHPGGNGQNDGQVPGQKHPPKPNAQMQALLDQIPGMWGKLNTLKGQTPRQQQFLDNIRAHIQRFARNPSQKLLNEIQNMFNFFDNTSNAFGDVNMGADNDNQQVKMNDVDMVEDVVVKTEDQRKPKPIPNPRPQPDVDDEKEVQVNDITLEEVVPKQEEKPDPKPIPNPKPDPEVEPNNSPQYLEGQIPGMWREFNKLNPTTTIMQQLKDNIGTRIRWYQTNPQQRSLKVRSEIIQMFNNWYATRDQQHVQQQQVQQNTQNLQNQQQNRLHQINQQQQAQLQQQLQQQQMANMPKLQPASNNTGVVTDPRTGQQQVIQGLNPGNPQRPNMPALQTDQRQNTQILQNQQQNRLHQINQREQAQFQEQLQEQQMANMPQLEKIENNWPNKNVVEKARRYSLDRGIDGSDLRMKMNKDGKVSFNEQIDLTSDGAIVENVELLYQKQKGPDKNDALGEELYGWMTRSTFDYNHNKNIQTHKNAMDAIERYRRHRQMMGWFKSFPPGSDKAVNYLNNMIDANAQNKLDRDINTIFSEYRNLRTIVRDWDSDSSVSNISGVSGKGGPKKRGGSNLDAVKEEENVLYQVNDMPATRFHDVLRNQMEGVLAGGDQNQIHRARKYVQDATSNFKQVERQITHLQRPNQMGRVSDMHQQIQQHWNAVRQGQFQVDANQDLLNIQQKIQEYEKANGDDWQVKWNVKPQNVDISQLKDVVIMPDDVSSQNDRYSLDRGFVKNNKDIKPGFSNFRKQNQQTGFAQYANQNNGGFAGYINNNNNRHEPIVLSSDNSSGPKFPNGKNKGSRAREKKALMDLKNNFVIDLAESSNGSMTEQQGGFAQYANNGGFDNVNAGGNNNHNFNQVANDLRREKERDDAFMAQWTARGRELDERARKQKQKEKERNDKIFAQWAGGGFGYDNVQHDDRYAPTFDDYDADNDALPETGFSNFNTDEYGFEKALKENQDPNDKFDDSDSNDPRNYGLDIEWNKMLAEKTEKRNKPKKKKGKKKKKKGNQEFLMGVGPSREWLEQNVPPEFQNRQDPADLPGPAVLP